MRLLIEVARHSGNAALAAATAASTSSADAKSTSPRQLAGGRVVDRAAAARSAGDAAPVDPVVDPLRRGLLTGSAAGGWAMLVIGERLRDA